MKTITFNIFTSLAEVKSFLKELKSRRYKHNRNVMREFAQEIDNEIKSGYWSNDISEYCRKELTGPYGKINKIYNEYIHKLK